MPRRRSVDDSAILEAARRAIGRAGANNFTLADVSEEVGLAPATLIQRFGSKQGLLVAMALRAQIDSCDDVERLLKNHASPLQALRGYLLSFADMASTPEEMANHLALFQKDVADPELRRIALQVIKSNEATVAALIRESSNAKELANCQPEELAPILLTIAQGSLLSWSLIQKGTAKKWVARHIDVTLRPYLMTPSSKRPRKSG